MKYVSIIIYSKTSQIDQSLSRLAKLRDLEPNGFNLFKVYQNEQTLETSCQLQLKSENLRQLEDTLATLDKISEVGE